MSLQKAINELKALKTKGITHSNRVEFLVNYLRTNGVPVIIR